MFHVGRGENITLNTSGYSVLNKAFTEVNHLMRMYCPRNSQGLNEGEGKHPTPEPTLTVQYHLKGNINLRKSCETHSPET